MAKSRGLINHANVGHAYDTLVPETTRETVKRVPGTDKDELVSNYWMHFRRLTRATARKQQRNFLKRRDVSWPFPPANKQVLSWLLSRVASASAIPVELQIMRNTLSSA